MKGQSPTFRASSEQSGSLIQALVARNVITHSDLRSARNLQGETGGQLLDMLVRLGAIDEDTMIEVAADVWGMRRVQSDQLPGSYVEVERATKALGVSRGWLERHFVMVWFHKDAESGSELLNIGTTNPLDPNIKENLEVRALDYRGSHQGVRVQWLIVSKIHLDLVRQLQAEMNTEQGFENDTSLTRLRELAEEAPIIDLVNQVLSSAIKLRASDIHIEPNEANFEVRFRVDGVMQTWQRFPKSKFDATSTRIKLISKMDIAERRLPQDGRQSIRLSGRSFDLRVSSLPGAWGESLVLRLLPKDQTLPSLDTLGLTGRSLSVFSNALQQPNGIVLVTGPTGSGKSTTLYTGLQSVNDGHKKIITIEDPIEFNMERVTQIQVKSEIGLTFASGLRSILRQDPDVIMIGEIRDPETARIAIQSSLTGHLVLSTLHTNTSLLAIPRLRDLGLESFQIGASVKALAAQRLVRRVCDSCAEPVERPADFELVTRSCSPEVVASLTDSLGGGSWRVGSGCEECSGTGYKGRVALFEIVAVDEAVRSAILLGKSSIDVEEAARAQGFRRLVEDGLEKAMKGYTTTGEVLRVSSEDMQTAHEAQR